MQQRRFREHVNVDDIGRGTCILDMYSKENRVAMVPRDMVLLTTVWLFPVCPTLLELARD